MTTKLAPADAPPAAAAFDPLEALRLMLLIRRFEERCLELSRQGEIAGSVHLCLGQEAIPAGAAQALGPMPRRAWRTRRATPRRAGVGRRRESNGSRKFSC